MMRVLALLTDAYGDDLGKQGGIALYGRNILRALCEMPDVDSVVAMPQIVPGPVTDLPEKLEHDTSGLGGKVAYSLAVVRRLATDRRFGLIVCAHIHLLPLAVMARAMTGAPILLFVYGRDVWQPTRHRIANRLARTVDQVASIRDVTTERMLGWSKIDPARVVLLENAIDLDKYGPGPKSPELVRQYGLADKTVLITVGRLAEHRKGFDEVIEALPRLAARIPNVVYLVVGSGPDEGRLRAKAAALGVTDRVVFAGGVAESEKPAHLRLGDVFVMAGSGDDFDRYPLRFVYLESMACGIPVVAARPESRAELKGAISSATVLVDPSESKNIEEGILEGLRRGRGQVVPELEACAFPAFRTKLHSIVDRMTDNARR